MHVSATKSVTGCGNENICPDMWTTCDSWDFVGYEPTYTLSVYTWNPPHQSVVLIQKSEINYLFLISNRVTIRAKEKINIQ